MSENKHNESKPSPDQDWLDQTQDLADQVKMLALNLAINLARSKNEVKELKTLEPQFTRLINGSVNIIRDINGILRALQSDEALIAPLPKPPDKLDRIEVTLNEILDLSGKVHDAIVEIKKKRGKVDNYK